MRDQIETNLKSPTGQAVYQAAYGKLSLVFCPSDETDDSFSPNPSPGGATLPYSQLSYACNSGVADVPSITLQTAGFGFDWPQNGVFECRLKGTWPERLGQPPPDYADSRLRFKNPTLGGILTGDGATNTILLTENADLEEWNDAPIEANVGIVWDDDYRNSVKQYLNKYPPGLSPPNTKPDTLANIYNLQNPQPMKVVPFARPLSLHPIGFMVAFCDGRVKFVSESIDYGVYTRLMTSDGKNYLPAGTGPSQITPSITAVRQLQMRPLTDDY
jgi:hypothetical protein